MSENCLLNDGENSNSIKVEDLMLCVCVFGVQCSVFCVRCIHCSPFVNVSAPPKLDTRNVTNFDDFICGLMHVIRIGLLFIDEIDEYYFKPE